MSSEKNDEHEGISTLKKHVYTISVAGKQADVYDKTTKAIGVGRVYGHEMKRLEILGKDEPPEEPEYPEKGNEATKAIWSKRYDLYLRKADRYNEQKAKVFTIILGQCEKAMKARVETTTDYKKADHNNDVKALMLIVKDIAYDSNEKKYPPMQAAQAWMNLSRAWQQTE